MLNSEAVAEPGSALSPGSGRIAPFGKYLLLQRVSVGGMAEVFKALPANADRIDQIVAIKRILPNIAEDQEFIGMFIDEARIAGQLHHPNICRIYELGRVNNDHYIAMQFLWGRDLLKLMNRYKKAGRFVSPMMAAFIGSKALSALHYAHTKLDENGQPLHIIHRDVSPQNIIVGYSGAVKLIDFGVARAASQSQKTQAGILKGKFGYMSPEMIRGLPIDHRSDVFAMGICLHELLTSTRLFYGETDFATLELVRDANVVPPSHKAPGVPAALDAIVMKALSREADDRYQDAEEMQQALEAFLASHDPQYGQTDVGMAMRQAFHTEVQRERDRLELFWGMLERGELVRGASVPASPHETGESGERNASASPIEALIGVTDAIEPDPYAGRTSQPNQGNDRDPQDDELQDEQTHIFFSSSELDEIRELEAQPEPGDAHAPHGQGPAATPRKPTITDLVPPPPTSGNSLSGYPLGAYDAHSYPPDGIPPNSYPRGGYLQQAAQAGQMSSRPGPFPPAHGFAPGADGRSSYPPSPFAGAASSGMFQRGQEPTQQVLTQSAFDRAWPATGRGREPYGDGETIPAPRRSSNLLRYGVIALLFLTVGVAAYAVPRFAAAGTGAIEVETVSDPDALVRVDGIVRGNPPLVVEGLAPGVHTVEIEASGYELARADVRVEKGQARALKLELEKRSTNKAPPSGASAEGATAAPSTQAGAAATGAAPTRTSSAPEITSLPPSAPDKPVRDRSAHAHAVRAAKATAELNEQAKNVAEGGEPTVQGSGGSETQVAEAIDEELAATNEGELLISTVPWSHVLVDSEDTGRDTPVRALRVTAGPHRIGLRTPDEVLHEVDVVVEAGKVVRIIRRF
ncbi:MAG: serine/threonine protein kinase [Myxococcaceae bacterium]|nr:serine/threonine protein kinase [Myxococcaceae bacterium]